MTSLLDKEIKRLEDPKNKKIYMSSAKTERKIELLSQYLIQASEKTLTQKALTILIDHVKNDPVLNASRTMGPLSKFSKSTSQEKFEEEFPTKPKLK